MDLNVGVDTLDIVESGEKVRGSVVNVEVTQRSVAGNIIIGVVYAYVSTRH